MPKPSLFWSRKLSSIVKRFLWRATISAAAEKMAKLLAGMTPSQLAGFRTVH